MKIFSSDGSFRATAIASCYARLSEVFDETEEGHPPKKDPGTQLTALEHRGLVYRIPEGDSRDGLYYLPSAEAKAFLATWLENAPASLGRLAKKALKPRKGALMAFPLQETEPGTEPDALHCFTTDWSPLPAACAIAVHPHHKLAPRGKSLPAFTGTYARHPLHGDLMPVWAVDWVAPDIGTGVVIVNPAHCAADLSFARDVGLPIRFGLVPAIPGPDSNTWIEPPVIRTGEAFRTGSPADGLTHEAASARYLSVLTEAGRAQTVTDYSLGARKVAEADPATGHVEPDSRFTALLDFLDTFSAAPGSWMPVLDREAGALEVAHLVCLSVDCGMPLPDPGKTIIVGTTDSNINGATDSPAGRLACLSSGAPADSLSLKQEAMDQAERFIANLSDAPDLPTLSDKDVAKGAKRSRKVMEHMAGAEPHLAFRELYRLQRDIKRNQGVGKADMVSFPALAYVMSGKGGVGEPNEVRRLLAPFFRP
ncbi:hypothetical protein [Desulfoluna butyratoxydans]|uniref:Valyl/leucyl/isoleucyl-trna synthetase editing domain n=1 Tax=Desulfoluna butyratoxydans TaxID=231438 RepID=A0A4U8YK36_9BACT|nr:hypothetical protein [Desulfoluna butyratoxydans]VFQ44175.1 valyl/leucyl/isoleucyl-trna synthetase editing domain [Desulfoluna butyratoxydans]